MLHLNFTLHNKYGIPNIRLIHFRLKGGRIATILPNEPPHWNADRCTWRNIKLAGVEPEDALQAFHEASVYELELYCDPHEEWQFTQESIQIGKVTLSHHNRKDPACIIDPIPNSFRVSYSQYPEWVLPVSWKAVGSVKVRAATLEAARDRLFDHIRCDNASFLYEGKPIQAEYADADSFQIDPEGHPGFWTYFQQAIRDLYNNNQRDTLSYTQKG